MTTKHEVVERLIREAHTVFERYGVPVSPGRVRKLVRQYMHRVQPNGFGFGDYLATQVAVSEMQRGVVVDELNKVIDYIDHTGERAVNNVLKSQGTRR